MNLPQKDLIFSLLPLIILIYLMAKKNSMPSFRALPLCALLLYIGKLVYFKTDPNLLNATVLQGLLTAFTPILVVWGAILLFKTMEECGSLKTLNQWLQTITTNNVAKLMIVGWAFGFFIEGASGFGTPAALAAPILVALGFNPLKAATFCLIMNSVPVSFGAVGTPTWFGFGELGLTEGSILSIGFKTALIHGLAALVIPVVGLRFVVSWKEIRKNILFVYLSISGCVVPYLICAKYNYEFPSIIGGLLGLIFTTLMARKEIGLSKDGKIMHLQENIGMARLIKASSPLWATVLILLVTRIGDLGIKSILTSTNPQWNIGLGSLGVFTISPSLVIGLKNIFNTSLGWVHNILYVPSILPFFAVYVLSCILFKVSFRNAKTVLNESIHRMRKPALALLGALVFVKIMMLADGACQSSAMIIGNSLAEGIGSKWKYFASYLGAVGAFFSGSNTVSNLTFGSIQYSIAQKLGLNYEWILSEQSVGGAMGNMTCIHNIVAVCSILGINNLEGSILKKTIWPMLLYGLLACAAISIVGLFS